MRRRSVWIIGGVAALAVVAVWYTTRKHTAAPTAAAPKPGPVAYNDTATGSVDAFLRAGGSRNAVI